MVYFIVFSLFCLIQADRVVIDLEYDKEREIDGYEKAIDARILNDTKNICRIGGNRLIFKEEKEYNVVQHKSNNAHPHHLDYLAQHVIILNYHNYSVLTSDNKLYRYSSSFEVMDVVKLEDSLEIP